MTAERLESRHLLAFTPFTEEAVVPGSKPGSYDLAVGGDGSYIVAYAEGMKLHAARYDAKGRQVGAVLTAASFMVAAVDDASVAMDADGGRGHRVQ